ncbi:vacuolar protein sorting-associated protein 16 homolog [Pomacea canaliculata]|uniref:vacuolar protein sorting-associated protein 16 homolog n=1 Tax=Pomacea canaliculata TaxID=400727 RepID=UPI000D72B5C0|nr:vacuolar protein sorting-associated protein 16 homolog [Pomacea canaliculata]
MATADWNPLGDHYYRKCEVYAMEWSGVVDLAKHTVAAAAYGGPIALMKDESKLNRVPTNIKPVITVYNAAGKIINQIRWNSGTIVKMGWTIMEDLLFVQDDGVVLVYDMFLTFKRTFSMGQEAKDVKILDARIFTSFQGTGVAIMTSTFRIFLITNSDSPRIIRLAEVPDLNTFPSCWDIVVMDRQVRALVAKGRELFIVDQGGQYQKQDPQMDREDVGEYIDMAVSFNNKFVVLFTSTGHIWMGMSDLTTKVGEFDTKSGSKPQHFAWCGNGAVVAVWERIMLVVGPQKYWIKYNFESTVHLIPEVDGLRIISNDTHEFLQRVPTVVEQIFKIGSMEPGAMLYEANKEYQKQHQKADEYLRMIMEKLDLAVNQCIQAAGHEFEPAKQKQLMRAASFGKCFLTDYRPEAFVNMCQMLRVLNQVRHHTVGIPLTYTQLEQLSMPVLIDRLVLRKLFGLAILICQYLRVPDAEGENRIRAHWACYKVQQKHMEEDQLARVISQKLLERPGVSFSDIASVALEHGRKVLAVKLLDFETRASEQVPLLLKMGQQAPALAKAIESGDTDLVYTVLLNLRDNLDAAQFYMLIHTMPIAFSLYLQYCRHQNLQMVEQLWEQEDNPNEIALTKIVRSYTQDSLDPRIKTLEDAGNCFHRTGNTFAEKLTEEQIKLMRYQRRLEDELGRSFADLSLHKTMYELTKEGSHHHVERLRKDFKVPDKRYWWMRVSALAEAGDWAELEKFSKSKKPPIGMEAFVEVCMKYYNKQEALKYLSRVLPEHKVKSLVCVGQFQEAADQAAENKNEDELNYVLGKVKVADKQLAETVRGYLAQLNTRR